MSNLLLTKVKPSHLTTGKAVFLVDAHLTGRSVLPVGPGRKVSAFFQAPKNQKKSLQSMQSQERNGQSISKSVQSH